MSKCDNDPIIKEGYLFLSNVLEHACLLKEVDFDKMVDIFKSRMLYLIDEREDMATPIYYKREINQRILALSNLAKDLGIIQYEDSRP